MCVLIRNCCYIIGIQIMFYYYKTQVMKNIDVVFTKQITFTGYGRHHFSGITQMILPLCFVVFNFFLFWSKQKQRIVKCYFCKVLKRKTMVWILMLLHMLISKLHVSCAIDFKDYIR